MHTRPCVFRRKNTRCGLCGPQHVASPRDGLAYRVSGIAPIAARPLAALAAYFLGIIILIPECTFFMVTSCPDSTSSPSSIQLTGSSSMNFTSLQE